MKYVNYQVMARMLVLSGITSFMVGCGSQPVAAPAAVPGATGVGVGAGGCIPLISGQPIGFTIQGGTAGQTVQGFQAGGAYPYFDTVAIAAGNLPPEDTFYARRGGVAILGGGGGGQYTNRGTGDGTMSMNITPLPNAAVTPGVPVTSTIATYAQIVSGTITITNTSKLNNAYAAFGFNLATLGYSQGGIYNPTGTPAFNPATNGICAYSIGVSGAFNGYNSNGWFVYLWLRNMATGNVQPVPTQFGQGVLNSSGARGLQLFF